MAIKVEKLYKDNITRLQLSLIVPEASLDRLITERDLHRPGLALAGFIELFTYHRVQILGNTEVYYLRKLSEDELAVSLEKVFQFEIPCMIVTNGNEVPQHMIKVATEHKIPIFQTSFETTKLIHLLGDYLDEQFAPQTNVHGSLVDVYGVGLLFTGRSGIGKSEISLDLVERGHRLVADDVVNITRMAEGILIGRSRDQTKYFLEVRGVGLIDVRRMFGIRAIRLQKRIEVEIKLEEWDPKRDYDRLGIEERTREILEVPIPYVVLPINPGKNITVIAETIALNQLLKIYGYHPAKEFTEQLLQKLTERKKAKEYLEHDFE